MSLNKLWVWFRFSILSFMVATIVGCMPIAEITSPNEVQQGAVVDFKSNILEKYADLQILDYSWSFGDGETAQGALAQHTYQAAGVYVVKLTVREVGYEQDFAKVHVTSKEITVSPPLVAGAQEGIPVVPEAAIHADFVVPEQPLEGYLIKVYQRLPDGTLKLWSKGIGYDVRSSFDDESSQWRYSVQLHAGGNALGGMGGGRLSGPVVVEWLGYDSKDASGKPIISQTYRSELVVPVTPYAGPTIVKWQGSKMADFTLWDVVGESMPLVAKTNDVDVKFDFMDEPQLNDVAHEFLSVRNASVDVATGGVDIWMDNCGTSDYSYYGKTRVTMTIILRGAEGQVARSYKSVPFELDFNDLVKGCS
jgi:PKD repeat protein